MIGKINILLILGLTIFREVGSLGVGSPLLGDLLEGGRYFGEIYKRGVTILGDLLEGGRYFGGCYFGKFMVTNE